MNENSKTGIDIFFPVWENCMQLNWILRDHPGERVLEC